jgi:hypothetical protein
LTTGQAGAYPYLIRIYTFRPNAHESHRRRGGRGVLEPQQPEQREEEEQQQW